MLVTASRRDFFSAFAALMVSLALMLDPGATPDEPAGDASSYAGTYVGEVNGYDATLEVSADGTVTYFNAHYWFFCNGMSTLNTAYWDTPVAVDSQGEFSHQLGDESISGTIASNGEASVYYKSFYLGCAGDVGVALLSK